MKLTFTQWLRLLRIEKQMPKPTNRDLLNKHQRRLLIGFGIHINDFLLTPKNPTQWKKQQSSATSAKTQQSMM